MWQLIEIEMIWLRRVLIEKKHIHRVYFKIQVYVHSFIQQMQIGYQRGVRHMVEMVNKTGGVG